MTIVQKVKRFAAVLLVCATFLPLSQCSSDNSAPPPPSSVWQHWFPRNHDGWFYSYAIEGINFSGGGLVTLLAFTWPLISVLLFRWPVGAGQRFAWLIPTLELLLSAGTAFWIYTISLDGQRLYGAYIAFFAVFVYAGAVLFPILQSWRTIRLRHPAPVAPSS